MSVKKQKLIAIVGPTASGKSDLAVRIARQTFFSKNLRGRAKKFNGEIVSADSRQIYRGLNIGSGKVGGRWKRFKIYDLRFKNIFVYKNILHYCIDEISPKRQYSVAEYKQCAERAIQDITSRGKIPILCGGTGFWIDAVVYDMSLPEVLPDQALRKKLTKKTAAELLEILKKLDPARAKTIEQKNPRRLIRAIEIARALGKVPSLKKKQKYDTLWLGIKKPKEELRRLIRIRLKKRLKQGMIQEIKELLRGGISHRRLQELGLEYRFISLYLQKKISREQMMQKLQTAIEQYARRQMVWFKRNKKIRWVTTANEAEKLVKKFLSPHQNISNANQ
ncbi:MAG: tRNA (adenosine(37)-N6)-dimethylallyltransferase MiaA [bacterium]|nr:tRNA (adenosine(37)-N6)-dimethylallyltransferase MiaA [bacterium]